MHPWDIDSRPSLLTLTGSDLKKDVTVDPQGAGSPLDLVLVPTLRVGMLLPTLCVVRPGPRLRPSSGRRASKTCVPTRSVGTRNRNSLSPK